MRLHCELLTTHEINVEKVEKSGENEEIMREPASAHDPTWSGDNRSFSTPR